MKVWPLDRNDVHLLNKSPMLDIDLKTAEPSPDVSAAVPSLTTRVAKSAGWVFVAKLLGKGLNLTQVVVLARLLAPEDFGLFGIVTLAIAGLDTFSQTGFGKALIQRKDNLEEYLDVAWTVQAIRGLVLALILFACAPGVGWFFGEPRTVALLRVMSISVALRGFANIGTIYFIKELTFHKQLVRNLVPQLFSLVIGIILAYQLGSVWALVWAGLAGSVLGCLFSYVLHPYRPCFSLDKSRAAELFRFGGWILASSIVIFLATHGDDALLGKVLGVGALGLYQMAYRLSNAPATEITHVSCAVMLPTYAIVQDQQARLARAFLGMFELVMAVVFPLTAFIAIAAPELVLGLLGPKWEAAVMPLRLLAVAGLLRSLAATGGPVFVGTGHPKMEFSMNLARASVIAVTIYPLTKAFGVSGTSFSIVLGLAAMLPLWTKVLSITGLNWRNIAEACWPGAALALLVPLGVCSARLLPVANTQMLLLSEAFAVGVFCFLGALLIERLFHKGPYVKTVQVFSTIRNPRPAS